MIDYSALISDKARDIKPSGIRKFFDIVNTMDDAISLGVGEPDFQTPWQIRRAGIDSLQQGKTFYTSNWGLVDLRKEISKYAMENYHLEYDYHDEIIVTVGGSEAIDNALRSFVSNGDEVLIPEPSFVCYTPLAMMAGGVPVPLKTRMEDGFKLTAETLKKAITPKTKVLIMPFPNNPTGAIMTRDELEEIAAVLRDTNIIVISDEIYCELTYGGKQHVCFAELPGMRERTIVINGFSKSFAMTGWRLGWVMAPREMLKPLVKIHQFGIMSAPTVSQFAGIEALRTGREDIKYMREQYDLRRRFMYYRLQEIGMPCFEPEGAFYIFPSIEKYMDDDEKFCDELLRKKKVAVVPGSAFGESGRGHVRISYSYSMMHLETAMERIEEFVQEL
ncbi:aminotransferase class I/II-fold pyridoxal phosphate-dependent enzyme [Butyricicoccus sp.]|uniref:aminotransferase class I/II-fold pyridoxal phosphate-dependent enzyme n=1 Tax=Butyricicoccus sp. TaxID=2049021 RepID=UPI003D7D4FD6